MCGQAVTAKCSACGAELAAGAKFCHMCGAEVGTAKKASAKVNCSNIQGFYGVAGHTLVSQSDRALVFCDDGGNLCRLDKDWNCLRRGHEPHSSYKGVAQTGDRVLALVERADWVADTMQLFLNTYDDGLKLLSETPLMVAPCKGTMYMYNMNERYAFALDYTYVDLHTPLTDLTITRWDLETLEERRWFMKELAVSGEKATEMDGGFILDGAKIYIRCVYVDGAQEAKGATLVLDTDTQVVSLLRDTRQDPDYEPIFFDCDRGIMWTHPRESECKQRGWRRRQEVLVARKIAFNAPILDEIQPWIGACVENMETRAPCGEAYFDGSYLFCWNPTFRVACAPGGDFGDSWRSSQSNLWTNPGTPYLWNNMVVIDLDKYGRELRKAYPIDYDYTEYDDRSIDLTVIDVED